MQEEQRSQPRLSVENTAFIELVAPGTDAGDTGTILRCSTLDVSPSGLRVTLEQELTVGAILQIGVELPHLADTLYLAGEVRWCHPEAAGNWSAGFALLNARDSDIARWSELLTGVE